MQHYDYLIVGAGLFGSVFAYKTKEQGKKCLVVDRRPHLGGNLYCEVHLSDLEVFLSTASRQPYGFFLI